MKRLISVCLLLLVFAPLVASGVYSLCVDCAPCCASDPCETCYSSDNDENSFALTFDPFDGIGEQVLAAGHGLIFIPTFSYHQPSRLVPVFSQVTDKTGHPAHAPPTA
jgi:hypothetical protein